MMGVVNLTSKLNSLLGHHHENCGITFFVLSLKLFQVAQFQLVDDTLFGSLNGPFQVPSAKNFLISKLIRWIIITLMMAVTSYLRRRI
jgi:hypothetical protein